MTPENNFASIHITTKHQNVIKAPICVHLHSFHIRASIIRCTFFVDYDDIVVVILVLFTSFPKPSESKAWRSEQKKLLPNLQLTLVCVYFAIPCTFTDFKLIHSTHNSHTHGK